MNTTAAIAPFDGENEMVDATEWIRGFEALSTVYGWNEMTRSANLLGNLTGKAKVWADRLKWEIKLDWKSMKMAFIERFKQSTEEISYSLLLGQRKQKENESLREYWEGLLSLIQVANPNMNESDRFSHLLRGAKPSIQALLLRKEVKTVTKALELVRKVETQEKLMGMLALEKGVKTEDKNYPKVKMIMEEDESIEEKEVEKKDSKREEKDVSMSESKFQGKFNRGNESYRGNSNYRGNDRRGRGRGRGSYFNNHRGSNKEERKFPQRRPNTFTPGGSPICNRCGGIGHYRKECRAGPGDVAAFRKKQEEKSNSDTKTEGNSNVTKSKNEQSEKPTDSSSSV